MTTTNEQPIAPVAADASPELAGECYRCGYSLVGVADDQPCPECGLLAGRSRRPTDELHHSRPGWLRRLSWGVWLILFAMVAAAAWPFTQEPIHSFLWENVIRPRYGNTTWPPKMPPTWAMGLWYHSPWLGADVAAIALFVGGLLLSRREGFAPADAADRWRRVALRLFALVPLVAVGIVHAIAQNESVSAMGTYSFGGDLEGWWTTLLLAVTLGCVPLPVLLFFQLRSLAKRARSAHLAEHCAIVGIGNSLTLLYVPVCVIVMQWGDRWGYGQYWTSRATAPMVIMLVLGVAAGLFALWNAYLLVSFAVAFGRASRLLRRQWRQSDRATAHM